MQNITLMSLILCLFLTACGGSNGGGGNTKTGTPKTAPKTPEPVLTPWEMAGEGSLSEESDANVRVLDFTDGQSVVYDGSAEAGDEQVCRRRLVEETDGTSRYYEVCMELTDDPYYIAPELNSLVWHPLMFDRFATELNCYIYIEGAARESSAADVDCASDVYPQMGGEGFTCHAGLINGDKALRCSDDWAVAVNGAETQTKSVCRVLLTDNTGLCLGAPRAGVEEEELILEMQQSSWDGYRSVQDNPQQFAPGDAAPALTPQDLPAGAVLTYTSTDESVCTVDEELGNVSIPRDVVAPVMCRIDLNIGAEGFADRLLFVEFPILKANDAAWGEYVRSNNYLYPGETLEAGAVLSIDPGELETMYTSLDESICTVDAQEGVVTAVAAGECGVRLRASAEGYLDVVLERSVPVDATAGFDASVTVNWGDFPTRARVGVDTAALNLPTVTGGQGIDVSGLSAAISYVSGECSYDDSSRIISFTGTDECVLAVSISGSRDQGIKVVEFKVTASGLPVTWAGYANGNAARYNADAPALVGPVVGRELTGVTYAYNATGGGCTVDPQSGALTIVGADRAEPARNCVVALTASHSRYTDVIVEQRVTVAKQPHPPTSLESYPYGLFGMSFKVGTERTFTLIKVPPPPAVGTLTYNSAGDCQVNATTGELTVGLNVTDCYVIAVFSGDDNTAPTRVNFASTTVTSNDNGAPGGPVWASSPYGTSIAVGAATGIVNAMTNASSGTGGIRYISTTPTVCRVVLNTGVLTGLAPGTCTLEAFFVGNVGSNVVSSAKTTSPNITVVQGSALPTSFAPYGASPQVKVGATLELVSDLSTQFGSATYSIDSGTSSHCTVDSAGVVTGVEVGNCTVRAAFAGNTNYGALAEGNLQTITVVKGDQTFTFNDVYGASPTLAVGETLSVVTGPRVAAGSDPGGAMTYGVKSGSATYCSVNAADGTITGSAPGECVIQVSAAATTQYAVTTADVLTIDVGLGSLASLSWVPDSGASYDPAIGASTVLEEVNVGTLSGVTVTYHINDAGNTGCTLSGRTVTFAAPGTCVVTARAIKTGYETWSQDHPIQVVRKRIPAPDTNPGFALETVLPVGGSPVAPGAVAWNTPLTGLEISWELVRGESDCELVDAPAGAVRARRMAIDPNNPPLCWLRLVVQREHYRPYRGEPISIPLSRGDLGTLTAPGYGTGNTLGTGAGTMMTTLPTSDTGVAVEPTGFAVSGTDGSNTGKADVCAVDDDASSANFGRVTAGSAAAAGDKCWVTVTVKALGYGAKDAPTMVLTVGGSLTFNTAPVAAWSIKGLLARDCVVSQGSLNSTCAVKTAGLPNADDSTSPVAVVWNYLSRGEDANGMSKDGVCTVVNNPGHSTHGDVRFPISRREGDTCHVTAFTRVSGYDDYSLSPVVFTIGKGQLEEDLYGVRYGTLRPGGSVAPLLERPVDSGDIAVTNLRDWRVVGQDDDNDGTADDANVCSIDENGAVSAGSALSAGDNCYVYVTGSAEGYEDREFFVDGSSTVAELGDLSDTADFTLAGPVYGDFTLRGGAVAVETPPSITPAIDDRTVTWSYTAVGKRSGSVPDPAQDICSVDGATGAVSEGADAAAGDTCEITARAAAPGYQPTDAPAVTLTLKDTFSSLAWASFPTTAAVGVNVDLSANGDTPVATPAADSYAVRVVSGDCAYSNAHILSFTDTTECVVRATVTKAGLADVSKIFRVTPGAGTIQVATWPAYTGVKLNVDANPPTITSVPASTTKVYALAEDSPGGCTVTSAGVVRGTAVGSSNCKVVVTLSANAYNDLSHTYTTSVGKGDQSNTDIASWSNPYGADPTITYGSGGNTLSITSQTPPSGQGSLEYQIKSSDSAKCTIGASTGVVTANPAGAGSTCTVQAQFGMNANYNASGYVDIATITINAGTIAVSSWGNYITLTVGRRISAPTISTTPSDVTKTYTTSTASSICRLSGNVGQIDGRGVGTCEIVLTLSKTGYANKEHTYTLTVGQGTQNAPTGNNVYGSNPALNVGGALAVVTAPTGGQGGLEYESRDNHCTVVADGTVTGASAGTCRVRAKWRGDANYQASGWSGDLLNVTVGTATLSGVDWTNLSAAQRVGVDYTLPNPTGSQGGDTITFSRQSGSDCTLAGSVLSFTGTADCVVRAVVTRPGFPPLNLDATITVTKQDQSAPTWSNAYGNSVSLAFGATAITPTGAPSGHGDLEYQLKSGSESYCSIVASTGAVSALVAGVGNTCVVQARFAGDNTYAPSDYGDIGSIAIIQAGQDPIAASNVYGTSPTVSVSATLDVATDPTGGQGDLEYRAASAGNGACTVDTGTGQITGALNGNCVVEARWAGNTGYEASDWSVVQTVTVGSGLISIDTLPSFAGTLSVGGSLTPTAPASTPAGTASYALADGETDCTLDSASTGQVTGSSVVVIPGETDCSLVVTVTASGYAPVTGEFSVDLAGATLVFSTNLPPGYTATALVIAGDSAEVGTIPAADDNSVSVDWSFSTTEECTVDNDPSSATFGDVTAATTAANGDTCTVTATASAAGYNVFTATDTLTIEDTNIADVVAGFQHVCALTVGGRVKCWGRNDFGQLGVDDTNNRGDNVNEMGSNLPFVDLGTGRRAVQLSAWYVNTCAILDDGSLKCWGRNDHGQLGRGSDGATLLAPSAGAINLGAGRTASMVAVGGRHVCAILDDGSVACWGRNHKGQLGTGNNNNSNTPQSVNLGERTAQVIKAGADHTCAVLDNGSLVCWGLNASGQLGIGNRIDSNTPQTVNLGSNRTVRDIDLGYHFSCAIWDDDSVKCWGNNGKGQLGNGDNVRYDAPSYLNNFINLGNNRTRTAQIISAGETHACGLLDNNNMVCWGDGNRGRLGYENEFSQNVPLGNVNLGTGKTPLKVSAGGAFTCALLNDRTVKCWGASDRGQMGRGNTNSLGNSGAGSMGDNLPIVPVF